MTGLVIRFWFGTERRDAVAVAHHDVAAAQFLAPSRSPSVLVPVVPVKLITSPGLIDLSISSTKPLTKLAGDGLQAEAEAEADRAGQHGERGEVEARGIEADQDAEADQEAPTELGDADARGRRQRIELEHAPFEPARGPQRGDDEDADGRPAAS